MIEISNLSKKYGSRQALDGLCLDIGGNSIFGLLGPNGAGKTTLISILNGLTTFDDGEVLVFGESLSENMRAIRKRCSLVPQSLAFYDKLTVKENLDFFAAVQGVSSNDIKKNIEFAIGVNRLDAMMTQEASTLSGGQKRRLNIAIGMLNNPDIIFFDEPTVGLDLESRNDILDTILTFRQFDKCVIYTSHYMPEIEKICDQIAIIDNGRIVKQGSIESMLGWGSDNKLIIEVYETPLMVLESCCEKIQLLTIIDSRCLQLDSREAVDVSQLLSVLEESEVKVKKINYTPDSLETVFLGLTDVGVS